MNTRSKSFHMIGPAVLAALFAVGVLAARALDLPTPASVVGIALALLGLRIGVVAAAAIDESLDAPDRSAAPAANTRAPALRVANG